MRRNFSQSRHHAVNRDRFPAAASHFDAVYRDEHLVVEVTRQSQIESAWLAGLLCGLGGRPRIGRSLLSGGPCISRGLLSRFEHLLNLCRSVFAPLLRRRLKLREGGEKLRPPFGELAGCDFVQVVAERLRERADVLARHSLSGLRVGGAFQRHQLPEELELNLGPKVSNGKNDPDVKEVGRRLVGPPLIEAYGSHDSVDRQNGEQDPFVKSVQTPFLQRCLRRKSQRRYQASQEERDCSEQGQEPARAVRPFRIFLTQIVVIDKPFFFQKSELFEECLDEFGKFQLGG